MNPSPSPLHWWSNFLMDSLSILPLPHPWFLHLKVFSMLKTAEFNLVFSFCIYVTHCGEGFVAKHHHDVLIFFEKSVYYLFSKTSKPLSALLHWNLAVKIVFKLSSWWIGILFLFYLPAGRIFGKNLSLTGKKFYLALFLFYLTVGRIFGKNLSLSGIKFYWTICSFSC